MIAIQTALEQSGKRALKWVQLSPFSRYNELHCGQFVCANLHWKKENFSTSGSGTTAQGSWSFKYTRYLRPNLEIYDADSGKIAADLLLDWSGKGQLVLLDGRKFDWLPGDRWGRDWQFKNGAKIPVLRFQPQKKWLKISAQIQIAGEYPGEPALSLLVLSGWFSLLMVAERGNPGVPLMQ